MFILSGRNEPFGAFPFLAQWKAHNNNSFNILLVFIGCFLFTTNFRKFRLGCKWSTTFRLIPLEIFRRNGLVNFWRSSPAFPLESLITETFVSFTASFLVFPTSSKPLMLISAFRQQRRLLLIVFLVVIRVYTNAPFAIKWRHIFNPFESRLCHVILF